MSIVIEYVIEYVADFFMLHRT